MKLKSLLGCSLVLTLASGMLWAQDAPKVAHTTRSPAVTKAAPPPAGYKVLFSNLSKSTTNLYNATTGYYVIGPNNSVGFGEQWIALPFTPTWNGHATAIEAAIGYISGASLVDLALYSDNGGAPGSLLAGGSSQNVPAFGSCCQLTYVSIPPTALNKNTQYWVVAATNDNMAPDFTGVFESTNEGTIAYDPQQLGWFTFSANVPAIAVTGTIP